MSPHPRGPGTEPASTVRLCGCIIEALVGIWGQGSSEGDTSLVGCSALFQDNPERAEFCQRAVVGGEGSPCLSGIWTSNCVS